MQALIVVPSEHEAAVKAIQDQSTAQILALLGGTIVNRQAPLSEVTPSPGAVLTVPAAPASPAVDSDGFLSVADSQVQEGCTPASAIQMNTVVTAKSQGYTIKPEIGLDSQMMPWCKEIHSGGKVRDKGTDTWRKRKGLDQAIYDGGIQALCGIGFGLDGSAPQVGIDKIPVVTPAVTPVTPAVPAPVATPTVAAVPAVPAPVAEVPVAAVPAPVVTPVVPEVPVATAPVVAPVIPAPPAVIPPVPAPVAGAQVSFAQVLDLVSKKQTSGQWTPEIATFICGEFGIAQIQNCDTVADQNALHARIMHFCPDAV